MTNRSCISILRVATLASAATLLACEQQSQEFESTVIGVTALGPLEAAFEPEFAVITTVREMPDGRVLVPDALGQTLQLVDMDAGTADTLGGVGQGPDEYSQPDGVWALPDGKTLLVDLGNGRLTELSPELEFGDTRPYVVGEVGMGMELVMAIPSGVDAEGYLYFQARGVLSGGPPPDSSYVVRLNLGDEVLDSLAQIKLTEFSVETTSSGNNESTNISQVPLSPQDSWGVASDGRVVVARAPEYRVEWISPDGTVTSGPPVPYEPVAIDQAKKEQWQNTRVESGGGASISVTFDGTSFNVTMARGGSSNDDDDNLDQYPWPKVAPPFYGSTVPVDPLGRAWIRRHGAADELPRYDLFDGAGERIMTVELSPNRRVVGFGDGTVYLARTTELGLQYLERHTLLPLEW